MHKINWHPSSEMLLNHSMGNTNEAESLIISSHLTYCSACKAEVAKYENIGGFYLKNHEELKVSKSLWNNLLDKIEDTTQDVKKTNFVDYKLKTRLDKNGVRIPSFLHQYLPNASDTENWSTTINNVKYYNINFNESVYKGKMLEIPPGKIMPKHSHDGVEATMVFHGGYSDEAGDYNKGDLVILEDNEEHTPISSEQTGCICLVVYSGSLKFKGLLGSILNLSRF
ncbi:MAG: ChrR family anti-sigma-E factor [Pseudomonadota bacterium]|nr:ChrR family anti-sigma-E factor [Pseudomonadota bacterium]